MKTTGQRKQSTQDEGWKATERAIANYQRMAREDAKAQRINEMVDWLLSAGSIAEAMAWKWNRVAAQ
jgi:hypothetical protein